MIQEYWSLAEKFLKKGFWLYLFSLIIAPIWYIIKIIASNELSVNEMWILYGIISLIILVSSYNDFGMSESLKYFIPKYFVKNEYGKIKTILGLALFIQILTGLLISWIFYFGSEYLAIHYFKSEAAIEALKIFAFFFLGFNILKLLTNFFLSIQDTFQSRLYDTIRMFGTMLLVLWLFFCDLWSLRNFSIVQIIWVYLWCSFAIVGFYYLYYKKYFHWVKFDANKKELRELIQYAFLVVIGTSAGTILGQIDMQMIIYILGTYDAGYYTNYLSIIGIPFMIITPIFTLIFPVISELHEKWEIEKIKNIKKVFSDIFISVWIMLNIFFFIFAETIAYTLFWEKFINSWLILQYSILFLSFNLLLQINFNLQAGIGNMKSNVRITIAAMFLNIITNIIFIKLLGVYGAALATGLGWIFMYTLSEFSIKSDYKSAISLTNLFKNLFVFTLLAICLYYIHSTLHLTDNRVYSFFILWALFLPWAWIFILTNYTMFWNFICEIKKIKWKSS